MTAEWLKQAGPDGQAMIDAYSQVNPDRPRHAPKARFDDPSRRR
jgi:hypothetical protein